MRTLGFGPKVLAFVAGALGLVLSLNMPWYGPAPAGSAGSDDIAGKAEELFGAVGRWFSESAGADGHASLQVVDQVFIGVAGLAVIIAVLLFVPATEQLARTGARMLAFVAAAAAVIAFFDQPGNNALVEPRHGLMFALGCAAVMLISAGHIGAATTRRKPVPTMTSMHDPTLRAGASRSVAPPN